MIATKHELQDMLSLHRELNLNVFVMRKYLETKKGIPDRENGLSSKISLVREAMKEETTLHAIQFIYKCIHLSRAWQFV